MKVILLINVKMPNVKILICGTDQTLGRGVPGLSLIRGAAVVALSKSHFHSSMCIYMYVLNFLAIISLQGFC